MRITEHQVAAFATAMQHGFASELGARMGLAPDEVARLVAAGSEQGLRGRRALSAYAALTQLSGAPPEVRADPSLPPDAHILERLDGALIGASAADRARVVGMLDRLLAPVGELVPPPVALERLQIAPRGVDEAPGAPVLAARGRDDALDNHWWSALSPEIVFVAAVTDPEDNEAWSDLAWIGGAPIEGHPNWRRLPRDRPAHHRVVATMDGRTAVLHLWAVAFEGGALVPAEANAWIPSAARMLAPAEPADWLADFRRD